MHLLRKSGFTLKQLIKKETMIKNTFKTSLLSLLVLLISVSLHAQSDFDIIKKRIVGEMMKPPVDDHAITQLVSSLKEDGTWPGINYEDVSRTGFEHRLHTGNIVLLARAYKAGKSKHRGSKKVKQAIERALGHWVEKDYFCDNWWHNQIGTPDNLVTVMLILGDELPRNLVDGSQPMIGRAHLTASGARPSGDRIKIGGILAKNLLFLGDKKQFDEVIKVIESEIKFSTGERGMQHDYSFHHREDRVNNTLSYGSGYAEAFAEWAAYVAGTSYAFSTEKINHLIDYYLDGICKQMAYGKMGDPGTKNRDITRPGGFGTSGTAGPERLMLASDYRKSELQEIIKIRKGEAAPALSYGKFFWQTEHYSHQRPGYFASVRMYSVRNRNMEEPYNGEGLKNHHRADGTNYLTVSGKEYINMAPVYDWQKIPGTTIIQKKDMPSENEIQKDGLTDFVGAVTDGKYGSVVFDFKSPHDPLAAKKAWFFFDEEYVCLGSGISSKGNLPVVTTLNQCLLEGEVTFMTAEGKSVASLGEQLLEKTTWVHHNNVGYLFPETSGVKLLNKSQSGTWYSVNNQSSSSKDIISMDVFKLWVDHGARLQNASYSYIVVPDITLVELETAPLDRSITLLANNTEVQAVSHRKLNISQMVFYKAAEVEMPGGLIVGCDSPGAVIIKTDGKDVTEISVSDPGRKLGKMHLTVSGHVSMKGDKVHCHYDAEKKNTHITVALPQDVYAGASVTVKK